MRIGILGGSFNPPHITHKKIATELINNNFVDKVIFVPTGDKYNKDYLVSSSDRYEMVKLMIKNNYNLSVSDYELNKELIYTYQTLDHFKNIYPLDEIYFICGADNMDKMSTWKNYKYILDNYKILVINRSNINILNKKNVIDTNISIDTLSSTFIRDNIDNDIEQYLDDDVYKYIKVKKLYK